MPSIDSNKLLELFTSLESSKSYSCKSDLLTKAKAYMFNEMSNEEILNLFGGENRVNFENLFNLDIWSIGKLDDKQAEFIESYEIIQKIFDCFTSVTQLLNKFSEQIMFLLKQSKDERVKHICAKHAVRLVKLFDLDYDNLDDAIHVKNHLENCFKTLLINFVREIPNTSVVYSQIVGDLISNLTLKLNCLETKLQEHQLRDPVFSISVFENNPDLIKEFETIYKLNSIQSFRVFEIIINLACLSKEHLSNICESRFNLTAKIDAWLNNNTDILSQLNCIELLNHLAMTNHGYDYFEHNNHLKHMLNCLNEIDMNPLCSFLQPALIKFFSILSRSRTEEIHTNYSDFYKILFKLALKENLIEHHASVNLAIETFSYLFEVNLIKKFFYENYEQQFLLLIERLVYIIQNSINDQLKTNSLTCLSEMISADPSLLKTEHTDLKWLDSPWITSSSDWSHLSNGLYEKVTSKITHENFFNCCLKYAQQPFANTRLAAQQYFKALAQTNWGISLLFTPNKFNSNEVFFDGYLLNRAVELEKEGLESKYELNKLILANFKINVDLVGLIGETNLEKLNEYVREGPFYSRTDLKVTFENQ